MLTQFQIEIQKIISKVISGSEFALAGAGALISQGLIDRLTNDLDYFSTRSEDVSEITPKVIEALKQSGMNFEIRQESKTFVRFFVERNDQSLEVDFGLDARLFPTQSGEYSPVLSTRELAVDKALAIFGRAAARDFVDFDALTQYFDLEQILPLAIAKDQGFSTKLFAEATRQFERLPRDEFHISESEYLRLRSAVSEWRSRALELSRDIGKNMGIDI